MNTLQVQVQRNKQTQRQRSRRSPETNKEYQNKNIIVGEKEDHKGLKTKTIESKPNK